MKSLPIGVQTFRDIINGDYLYVDKTKQIYNLVQGSKGVYFLSRPRRFGKSLLVDTLCEIFSGDKDLFKGLYIEGTDYKWEKYPVIRIDFSSLPRHNVEGLKRGVKSVLKDIAEKYDLVIDDSLYVDEYFKKLISKLSEKNKVAILIDEYDAPLIANISKGVAPDIVGREKEAEEEEYKKKKVYQENLEFLKDFYTIIKAYDKYIRFVFLTGVSKFSKAGVFSGLNNLEDITMTMQGCDLLGWTQEELEENFKEHISELAKKEELSEPETIEKVRYWYDGYRFSDEDVKVYNPFSTLLLFKQRRFREHWFETGTPTFLINLIKKKDYVFEGIGTEEFQEVKFSSYDAEDIEPLPLLLQTGYLTISDYNKKTRAYKLDYPNYEVKTAFISKLSDAYLNTRNISMNSYLDRLIDSLEKYDLKLCFKVLETFLANVDHKLHINQEKYYQTLFYSIFMLLGSKIHTEVHTNLGRIDAVIETSSIIYIFEFKLNKSKEKALKQIKEKKYYQKYQLQGKRICLVGAKFDYKNRNVGKYVVEEIKS